MDDIMREPFRRTHLLPSSVCLALNIEILVLRSITPIMPVSMNIILRGGVMSVEWGLTLGYSYSTIPRDL